MKQDKELAQTTEAFKLPSKAEIEALKQKHGELFQITVTDQTGKEHHAILRKPGMSDMQIASASEKKKPFTFNLSIWSNCKVVADPAIDASEYLLLGAFKELGELVEQANSSIKKL